MSIRHACEQCGRRFTRRSKRDSLLCHDCRERRARARYVAAGRARTWLAGVHAEAYGNLYAEHVARARAQDPEGSSMAVRNRARSRALGELQRRHYGDYRQRYEAELARAQAAVDQQAAKGQAGSRPAEPRVPYWQQRHDFQRAHAVAEQRAHAAARLRALLWLADRYPDTTAAVFRAQAARLPLNPADRTPAGRRALAWAATLDRLARLHPAAFQARYGAELANLRGRWLGTRSAGLPDRKLQSSN
jgi:ribosomal protein L37AE/L43A